MNLNIDKGERMQPKDKSRETILTVAKILIDELRLEDVTPETFDPDINLVDEVGIDSMDLATVALVLQDEYGIAIDEEDYPKLQSIRLIAEYVLQQLALEAC
jgi:acyl carrier protein